MKSFLHLLMMSLIALGFGSVALLSIQNVTPVSLMFLNWASIQLPIGVMLSFCLAGGLVLGAILPLLMPTVRPRRRQLGDRDAFDFD